MVISPFNLSNHEVLVVYDGACPFCSQYVNLQRLKESYHITLQDARTENKFSREIHRMGFDLNEGMIVVHGNKLFFGKEAVHHLTVLQKSSRLGKWLFKPLFGGLIRSSIVYPILRNGRKFFFFITGRKLISQPTLSKLEENHNGRQNF